MNYLLCGGNTLSGHGKYNNIYYNVPGFTPAGSDYSSGCDGSHEWETEKTGDASATCVSTGSASIHCINCGDAKESEIIAPIDHKGTKVGKTKSSKKIKKLAKKTVYYVQVRTYVSNGNGTFYSPWSAVKSVKTR